MTRRDALTAIGGTVLLATAEASRVQALVGYRTALASLERSTAHRFATD